MSIAHCKIPFRRQLYGNMVSLEAATPPLHKWEERWLERWAQHFLLLEDASYSKYSLKLPDAWYWMVVGYAFIKCEVDEVEMKNEVILLQTKVCGEGMDLLLS